MQIGIIGLPYSGKSTIFSTLMQHKSDQAGYKNKQEAVKGIVKVPDTRLDQLSDIFNPKSKVNSTIEYIKVPGFEKTNKQGSGLPPQFIANVKTVDAILLVIRSFENELYPHPFDSVNPKRDIDYINSEMLLSDLTIIESRLEKLEKSIKQTKKDIEIKERDLLKRCEDFLNQEKPLREISLTDEEEKTLRGFQFLTAKPLLYVLNINEDDISGIDNLLEKYKEFSRPLIAFTALCGEIEKEIAELDPEDQQTFLQDLNISEPALHKLIRSSYELLGLISFFTVGEDECRAWTIKKGSNAQQAAGAIHSDLERGFIRADVVYFQDLLTNGSLKACKEKGVLGLEGKEYSVKDGDVMEIRFNV